MNTISHKRYILPILGGIKGDRRDLKVKCSQGFTLMELLIVVSIIGIMMTVVLPISVRMYYRYQASLKAQAVMVAISDLRRESFLYSERKILSSTGSQMTINGETRIFADTRIRIDPPIRFYKNGTTSGGVINMLVGDYAFALHVKPPLGDLHLDGGWQGV